MLLKLSSIAEEREEKIRSMLTDQIRTGTHKLWQALERLGLSSTDRARIRGALEWATVQNYGARDVDRHYVGHPIRVARFMAAWVLASSPRAVDAVVAAIIHTALEKKLLTVGELERAHGRWVRSTLEVLTPDRKTMAMKQGRVNYYVFLNAQDAEVQTLKFFDKFDNLFALCINPDANVREDYLAEIEEHVRPIAGRHCAELLGYLDELIADTRRIGHYRPTYA